MVVATGALAGAGAKTATAGRTRAAAARSGLGTGWFIGDVGGTKMACEFGNV